MNNNTIHFKCDICNEKYHSSREYSGRMIQCGKCGKIITIPSGLITNKTKPTGVNRWLQFLKKIKSSFNENIALFLFTRRGILVPISALLIAIIGSFFTYLFPLPLLIGVCLLGWWQLKSLNLIWAKALTGLLKSTMWGLSILLALLILLNYSDPDDINNPPIWLLKLDNALIWSKTNLDELSEFSLGTYILLIISLIIWTYIKPNWQLITKYGNLEQIVGRISTTLLVITSFTFFAPTKVDTLINQSYYKHYTLIVRENLRQERRALIAENVSRKLLTENNSLSDTSQNLFSGELKESFSNNEFQQNTTSNDWGNVVKNAAQSEVGSMMNSLGQVKIGQVINDAEWEGIGNKIASAWEKNSQKPNWIFKRAAFVEGALKAEVAASLRANEAVEGVKGIFSKMISELFPELKGILGKYIEEALNTAVEYSWKGIRADEIVAQFFDTNRPTGKFDLFGKIAAFWDGNKNVPENQDFPTTTDSPFTSRVEDNIAPPLLDIQQEKIYDEHKHCGKCGRKVPDNSHMGQHCPYCGVLWAYED